VLEQDGPFDIIHAHPHQFNGMILRAAALAGVPVRIAHSHTDTRGIDRRANPLRAAYLRLMESWIRRYATHGLAVSRLAAASLFGEDWESDPRVRVLYSGVDLDKFRLQRGDRELLRRELGIPAEAKVFAHVGRFAEPKNHPFLIEIFAAIGARMPHARFVLMGDGPLRSAIENAIDRAGIRSRTVLLGMRNDVPRLLGLVDVLLLPSLWEGLPIALVESQAAGVPALYSDAITAETEELPHLLRQLPLSAAAAYWAEAAISLAASAPLRPHTQPLAGTRFDIRTAVAALEDVYLKAAAACPVKGAFDARERRIAVFQ